MALSRIRGQESCARFSTRSSDSEKRYRPEDALTWCIGPPLQESFRRLLGSEVQAEQGVKFYRERFGEVGLYENRVYDGMEVVLETLARRDVGTLCRNEQTSRLRRPHPRALWAGRVFRANLWCGTVRSAVPTKQTC